jgi:hypothetical protein
VRAAIGLAEYLETTHNWLGFNTGHLQEVYSYSVRSEQSLELDMNASSDRVP